MKEKQMIKVSYDPSRHAWLAVLVGWEAFYWAVRGTPNEAVGALVANHGAQVMGIEVIEEGKGQE